MTNPAALSARELECLQLIANGATRDEVAATLSLTPSTINSHLARCRFKLGAQTTAQAVAIAIRGGVIR